MKKFLSIKNTQGIYVARASFSSDETVIDFVNSKYSDHSIAEPVSIVVTPDQLPSSSSLNTPLNAIAYDSISVQSQSQSQSLVTAKSSNKKKLKARLLKFLHIKKKAKMSDDAAKFKKSDELPSTSGSYPKLPTPKMLRNKGRTASLVKKFTLTPKKSPPPKELSRKKSLIPLRTATSVEALSNAPQSAVKNRIETTATVSHHSMSEMNLVNIDYRQEISGNNSDTAGVRIDKTRYQTNWDGNNKNDSISADKGANSSIRSWNANSNMSIRSGNSGNNNDITETNSSNDSKMAGSMRSTSTEKLQITITGKKRTNNIETATNIQQQQQRSKQQLIDIEPKKIERKAIAMQLPSTKLNTNHDLTLMNTIGVPPAPTTQAPMAIPTTAYRTATTTASMKKIEKSHIAIKAQSTMQSQQSVDTSASAADVEKQKNAVPKRADTLITVTSFDVEELDDIAASSKCELSSDKTDTTSLLTEIIEAERRNSVTMEPERGHRYPGTAAAAAAAANETTEFPHQASTSNNLIGHEAKQPKLEIIPKVIIDDVTSLPSESSGKSGKRGKSAKPDRASEKKPEWDANNDNEEAPIKTQDDSGVASDPNEDNELSEAATTTALESSQPQPTLQFERRNMSSSPEKREHLYKILVIGELGTGKTSFIKRYVHQFFSQNYRATIGVDFALKVLNWDQNTIIRLQLWDIAGQERFGNMTRVYYKEAVGAFIVFDVTRSATFDAVIKWKQDLDSKVQLPNGSPIPCILIANKCDQSKQGIVNTPAKMDDYVKEHGFAGWFETSAKENINIEEAARALVNKILLNDKIINAGEILDADKFNLDGSSSERSSKKSCSC